MQQLKINITADDNINILSWVNGSLTSIDDVINLDFNIDNVIEFRQEAPRDNVFFYIESVWLGGLNITELLHRNGICQVQDADGNKIADFIPDIGPNDRVIISIKQDFYRLIVKNIDIVKVL